MVNKLGLRSHYAFKNFDKFTQFSAKLTVRQRFQGRNSRMVPDLVEFVERLVHKLGKIITKSVFDQIQCRKRLHRHFWAFWSQWNMFQSCLSIVNICNHTFEHDIRGPSHWKVDQGDVAQEPSSCVVVLLFMVMFMSFRCYYSTFFLC